MATKRAKRMLGNVAMLLAPIGAIKLATFYFAPAPPVSNVAASATEQQTTAPTPNAQTVALSKEEIQQRNAAKSYALGSRAMGFRSTPFYYERAQVVVTTPSETPDPEPEIPGVPSFTVQVIMASESDSKALIDGKVYRVGDEFREGWIIADIDGVKRTVTIADPATSRTSTRSVRLRGE